MHRLIALAVASLAAIAAAPLALANAIVSAATFAWNWLKPEPDRNLIASFDFDGRLIAMGCPPCVEPAVLNSLRHEAGMRPLRC